MLKLLGRVPGDLEFYSKKLKNLDLALKGTIPENVTTGTRRSTVVCFIVLCRYCVFTNGRFAAN